MDETDSQPHSTVLYLCYGRTICQKKQQIHVQRSSNPDSVFFFDTTETWLAETRYAMVTLESL